MPKLSGADCVAIVLAIGCFVLIGLGHNHIVEYTLAGIATAYGFGKVTAKKLKK